MVTWTTPRNFNPRPPRGERQRTSGGSSLTYEISIHALREESDKSAWTLTAGASTFQSTPSARRATHTIQITASDGKISIHALREESDRVQRASSAHKHNFNPRPPRGERLLDALALFLPIVISIHALREESDGAFLHFPGGGSISIHALREESDFGLPPTVLLALYFNPRPPRGERPKPPVRSHKLVTISIHALREESDGCWG